MWYRKAMDLSDLNREFAIEKENAVEDYDEQAMKEGVEDLFGHIGRRDSLNEVITKSKKEKTINL